MDEEERREAWKRHRQDAGAVGEGCGAQCRAHIGTRTAWRRVKQHQRDLAHATASARPNASNIDCRRQVSAGDEPPAPTLRLYRTPARQATTSGAEHATEPHMQGLRGSPRTDDPRRSTAANHAQAHRHRASLRRASGRTLARYFVCASNPDVPRTSPWRSCAPPLSLLNRIVEEIQWRERQSRAPAVTPTSWRASIGH